MKPWFEREQEITEFKEPVVYKGLNISVSKTKVKPPYIATITSPATGKEVLKAGGDTEQEALDSAKQAIDKREADAPQISAGGKTSVLLNTPSNNELLKDPSMYNTVYAKISKDKNGPTLVIGNEVYGSADLEASGFVGSYDRRMKKNRDSEEALPQIMFNANNKFLSQSGIKMNGRYSLDTAGKYRDEDEHTVYPLQFQGSTVHSGDRLRMNRPALTIGATREDIQPWFQRELEEAEVIKFPEPEKKVVQMPNVASYPDFITGVSDLKARMGKGEISQASHDKLYTDLIHRFMRKEDVESPWFLRESQGLSGRKPGDEFVSQTNPKDIVTFVDYNVYPTKTTQSKDKEELLKFIDTIKPKYASITPVNNLNNAHRALAIATFKNNQNQNIAFVKFARDTIQAGTSPGWWSNTKGIPGYTSAFKRSKMSSAKLSPQDVIIDENKRSSKEIIEMIGQKLGTEYSDPLKEMVIQKTLPKFIGKANDLKAIGISFGEIFGPIAIVNKVKGMSGGWLGAEKLLGKYKFENCEISFPQSVTNKLIDSELIAPNGFRIGVSSKFQRGAPASITNIHDEILKLEKDKKNIKLLKENKYAIDIIKLIARESKYEGPIKTAEILKLISTTEANEIRKLWNPKSAETDIKKFPGLQRIYQYKKFKNVAILRFAVLANTAKIVADSINAKPDFSTQTVNLLNQSSIIQAYTRMSTSGDDAIVTGIDTVYPPNFKGTIYLDAAHNYWGKGVKDRISFSMPPAQ